MTCREKLAVEHPDAVGDPSFVGGCRGCPSYYGYMPDADWCCEGDLYKTQEERCSACWDREIPGSNLIVDDIVQVEPHILDSGERREFESGAVRDIQEGKGRCDLMPLDVVAALLDGYDDKIIGDISEFLETGDYDRLYHALSTFSTNFDERLTTMFLEVSKHFEEGAKKYGEYNWQKGMPVNCYIDSAVRHYLKFLRGDKDEPHDRAFVWNLMCCIWTCKHKPELNEYGKNKDS